MPNAVSFYDRLAKDYAKPRQYSGYSSGAPAAPAGTPSDAVMGDVLSQMRGAPTNNAPPRMSPNAFAALSQGFAPTMPGMTPQDRMNMQRGIDNQSNAFLARNIIPGAQNIMPQGFTPPEEPLPESTFAGGHETANPQGPPMPLPMRFAANANALARNVQDVYNAPDFRQAVYPYLQNLGLAR